MTTEDVYASLAEALDRLPNGFPRTRTGVELRLLRKICSPEEAWLACQLTGAMEPVETIASRVGLPGEEVQSRLKGLARRGLAWADVQERQRRYRLAPFIVGIYEAQVESMDHELAHLFEAYLDAGGAAGIMQAQPALHRVIPTPGAARAEWVLPYDDVRALLRGARRFRRRDCICRVERDLAGHGCAAPRHNCLTFSSAALPPTPADITLEAALALLDEAEKAALVHTVGNVARGVSYVCNCCGCCCGFLRAINERGFTQAVAQANYYATIDPQACLDCGTCRERCQVHAIGQGEGVAVVDRARCIGCGLCVTGCPNGVPRLQRKPEAEIIHPPADYAAWERARLAGRQTF